MGNGKSQDHVFNKEEWDLIERAPGTALWRNRGDPSLQVEQFDVYSKDNDEY